MPDPIAASPLLSLTPADLESLQPDLEAYYARYGPLFARSESRAWGLFYLQGLLSDLPRKSAERLVLGLRGPDRTAVRSLQLFLNSTAWRDAELLAAHWQAVAATLGTAEGVLILDGSDFAKQGQESVGVKRQYCGELGKKANCQAGVFLGYASDHGATLVHRGLYLPAEWVADPCLGDPAGPLWRAGGALLPDPPADRCGDDCRGAAGGLAAGALGHLR